jgi:hypothetical protein
MDLLSPDVLLGACGHDAAILEAICQAFRENVPIFLAAVKDALQNSDAPRLREAAHKLIGIVGAFSTVAGGLASEIEDRAAHGQLDDARPLVEQLEKISAKLLGMANGLSIEILERQAER